MSCILILEAAPLAPTMVECHFYNAGNFNESTYLFHRRRADLSNCGLPCSTVLEGVSFGFVGLTLSDRVLFGILFSIPL